MVICAFSVVFCFLWVEFYCVRSLLIVLYHCGLLCLDTIIEVCADGFAGLS